MWVLLLFALSPGILCAPSDEEVQYAEVFVPAEESLKYAIRMGARTGHVNSIVLENEAEGTSSVFGTLEEPELVYPSEKVREKRQAEGKDWWKTVWKEKFSRKVEPTVTTNSPTTTARTAMTTTSTISTTEAPETLESTLKPLDEPLNEIPDEDSSTTKAYAWQRNWREQRQLFLRNTALNPSVKSTTRQTTSTTTTTTTKTTTTPEEPTTTEEEFDKLTTVEETEEPSTTTSTTTKKPSTARPTTKPTVASTTTTAKSTISQGKFRREFDQEKSDQANSLTPEESSDLETTTKRTRGTRKVKTSRSKTTRTTTSAPEEEEQEPLQSIGSVVAGVLAGLDGRPTTTLKPKPTGEGNFKYPIISIEKSWLEEKPELDPRKSSKLREIIVDKLNQLRSMVEPAAANMLKVEWSDEAQKIAQRWAKECKFEHDRGEDRKTKQFKCGQNLARGWPNPLSWNLTQQLWFDERKDFVWDGAPRGVVGHYTQMVWAQSYQVGCAYHNCGTFHYYICNYCPAGNIDTKKYRPYQIGKRFCEACKGSCDGKLCTNPCPFANKYGNCGELEAEFGICADASYGLQDSCEATCKCGKSKIYN